jgi:hypothetical protein
MNKSRRFRLSVLAKCGACACVTLLTTGCFPFEDFCSMALTIRGEVRDAETGEPIADAPIGGRTITNGLITAGGPAVNQSGEPVMAFTEADGTFVLKFSEYFYEPDIPEPCEFTRPDRVQIIIVRDGCEERPIIDIDEDTAVFFDREYPNDSMEFTAPVLVRPCAEEPAEAP